MFLAWLGWGSHVLLQTLSRSCGPPSPPVGCGCGDGLFQPSLMAGQNHALRHVRPAIHQNAAFACTAVLQIATTLCQASPYAGFSLIP